MRLWNIYTGQNTLTNYGTLIRNQFVNNLTPLVSPLSVFGGSPSYVFMPSDDRSILMFDLLDGSLVKRLKGSYGRVTALAWRPRTQVRVAFVQLIFSDRGCPTFNYEPTNLYELNLDHVSNIRFIANITGNLQCRQ